MSWILPKCQQEGEVLTPLLGGPFIANEEIHVHMNTNVNFRIRKLRST